MQCPTCQQRARLELATLKVKLIRETMAIVVIAPLAAERISEFVERLMLLL